MKKALLSICLLLVAALLLPVAEASAVVREGVSVSVQGSGFKGKKAAEKKAKEEAIRSYIVRTAPGTDRSCIERLVKGYGSYVRGVTQEDYVSSGGSIEAAYRVTLDDSALNRAMEEMGCGVQSGKNGDVLFFIMEERPDSGSMMMILNADDSSGMRKLRGLGPFVTFYTSYQRRIRDAITAKAGTEGLSLRWLEKEPRMEQFKVTPEDPLTGVYYDTEYEEFAFNDRLMKEVKNRYAGDNAIIFYYRLDSLYFDQVKRRLKAVISISLMDLASGNVKSVGAQSYEVSVPEGEPGVAIRDGLAQVATNAASLLMNDAKKVARSMASQARNRMAKETGKPAKVTVLLKSKRSLFKLKQSLNSKSVNAANITGQSLVVDLNPGVNPEEFVFTEMFDALDQAGVSIPEQNIRFEGSRVFMEE